MSAETEQLQRSWLANAEAWRDAVRTHGIASRRLVTDAAIVAAVLEEQPKRVLDVGCGEGWLARALSERGIAVTGVDASAPLIEAARELGGGEFVVMSYDQLAAQPLGSFDAIVANFALLDDRIEALLSALRSMLAIDGRLIIQTVHPWMAAGDAYADGWRTETFASMPGQWPESMPWYFRSIESWSRVLAGAGYPRVVIREPMYPDRAVPASMMFICRGGAQP